MTGRLAGKSALITGGGRGIGQAIASLFVEEGASVAVADIDMDTAAATARNLGAACLPLGMDVTDRAQVQSGVDQAVAAFGGLDILVNNAGHVTFCTFEDCSEALWDRILAINLKGPFFCIQAVLPHMKQKRSGTIINMTSVAAKTGGLAAGPPYGASKAGVAALTIALARESAPFGVRANGIAPGVIDTDMTRSPAHDAMTADIPLGQKGKPEDVANCALFLASEESRHITGEIIDVNGGLFMD
jgi:NAD(P)-dependent dehydrogenase (short-subunit alcohol dehydrogenase family)